MLNILGAFPNESDVEVVQRCLSSLILIESIASAFSILFDLD